MDDLISRQDAVDALCNQCSMTKVGDRCTDDFCPDVRRLQEVPSAQKKGKWIPCSERLPSDEDYDETFTVTIQCEHYDGWDDYVTGYADWTPHGWDMQINQSYYLGVIAWMPLPEPYSGAEMKGDFENERT